MQKNARTKLIVCIMLGLAAGAVFTPMAWAACAATCAVTENAKMDFATLQKPAAGSTTLTIAPDTNATSGTATILYGSATRGVYTLTRTGATTGCTGITVSVTNVSTGDAGITLGSWYGWYNSNGATLPLTWTRAGVYPATSPGTIFRIGATATIASTANSGAFTPSFDLTCTIN